MWLCRRRGRQNHPRPSSAERRSQRLVASLGLGKAGVATSQAGRRQEGKKIGARASEATQKLLRLTMMRTCGVAQMCGGCFTSAQAVLVTS